MEALRFLRTHLKLNVRHSPVLSAAWLSGIAIEVKSGTKTTGTIGAICDKNATNF
jgi:hypothetical protein